jgi:tRNA wybutosine-synthesizing protein 1
MRNFKGRRVLRLTLIKNMNLKDKFLNDYLKLINKASPDFLEVKAFMNIGYSRNRLGEEYMPSFDEIKSFARIIEEKTNYQIENLKENSRIVLLKNENSRINNKFLN